MRDSMEMLAMTAPWSQLDRIAVEQVGDRVLVPVEVDRDGGQARQMAASGVKYSGRGKLLSFCFMSIKCRPTATIL